MVSDYVELACEKCCSCDMLFWITKKHQDSLKLSKESFYCPNGHSQSYYGKTDKQKLKESQEETKRIKGYWNDTCNDRNKYSDDLRKAKRKIKKLQKDALQEVSEHAD